MWWTSSFIHQSVIAFTDFWLRVGCFYFHKSRVKEFRQVLEAEICTISLHWPDCSTRCENSVMSIILAESGPHLVCFIQMCFRLHRSRSFILSEENRVVNDGEVLLLLLFFGLVCFSVHFKKILFSFMGYHRILTVAPSAIQKDLVVYLYYR